MAQRFPQDGVVFRTGGHLFVIVGLFASLFLGLGLAIGIRRGDWTSLALAAAATGVLFLLLSYLRLEIREGGFTYRNLSMNRSVEFTQVERAYFETIRMSKAPQGVAAFRLGLRDGSSMKINLRTFPIRAAALLFTALERHGIEIEVPDTKPAQRMASQIRREQAKLDN